MVKKRLDLAHAHFAWMAHDPAAPMPAYEEFHPIQVDFFSAQAIVKVSDSLANLIQ
jgi:hypothetical protein